MTAVNHVPVKARTEASPRTRSSIAPTLGLLPVLAVSAFAASPVVAQQSPRTSNEEVQLDTITLTGGGSGQAASEYRVTEGSSPKLTAPLRDTPKTVAVITQRQMEERNATSVLEVLRTTPGVTLGSGEGGTPLGDRFFMRGYQASTDMMIDGVRNLGRTTTEAFNTESIEVVKGAGGAYSGRGATGGSINLVTKQARIGETFNNVSTTIGNGKQKRLSYDGNLDLGNGMAARLNMFVQDSGVPGRDVLKDDRQGIALAFTKELGASKFSISASHSDLDATPDLGVPMETTIYRGIDPVGTPDRNLSEFPRDNPGRPIETMPSEAFFGSASRDFREVTNQDVTLKFEHEFSDDLRLSATAAYIGSEQYYMSTRPTINPNNPTEVLRALRAGARKNHALAFQTALSGTAHTGSLKHDFVIGLEHSQERSTAATTSGPAIGNTSLTNPNPYDPIVTDGLAITGWGKPVKTTSSAIYAFDTIEFNQQWSVNLGLRYDKYKVNDGTRVRKDNMLNYSAAVIYKPTENGTIYASLSTSSNPSGECAGMAGGADGAGACTLNANNANLEPEKSKSFELGTKWELFDNQLLLSAALFRTEKNNARTNDPLITGGTVALAGKNSAQGIELGVAGQINDRWGISAGYAYTDATLDNGEHEGNQLQFNAKNSFSIWSTYAVNDKLTLGGGATYTDKRYLDQENTMILPSQWRVDAMASYAINDQAALQINVNNIFDERLYDASHVGLFANRAPGRSVTAKLDYKF